MSDLKLISRRDYLNGLGTPKQRAQFEMVHNSIDPARIRRAARSRRYLVVRWIVRGIVKIGIVLLVILAIRWLFILLWAGFGS